MPAPDRKRSLWLSRRAPSLLAMLGLVPLGGCMAYSNAERDLDRTPIVNVGSRASIIYPGQSAPAFPTLPPPPGSAGAQNYSTQNGPNGQSGQSNQYGAPPPQNSPQNNPQANAYPQNQPNGYYQNPQAPGGGPQSYEQQSQQQVQTQPQPQVQQADPNAGMTMLGGAREDVTRHTSIREDPLFMKYLTAPLAVAAAPFVLAKEAIQGEPEPGPPVPRPPNPTSQPSQPPPPRAAPGYEERRMQDMARELAERQARRDRDVTRQAMSPEPTQTASLSTGGETHGGGSSIADELEALRRQPESPRRGSASDAAPRQPASSSSRRAAPTDRVAAPTSSQRSQRTPSNSTTADGIVDRNGDGRIDQWIFRNQGEIEREELDEDFDGRVDRIIHTDLDSHKVRLVEEDNRGGGVIDTWTDYRDGVIARRRSDTDGDGTVDTWSFYHSGELVRHEQDTTHDGFRDAITSYREGKRVSETRDLNADGTPDVELFYDANDQVVRREEDADGDGTPEVISHYQNGRLVRKELLDAPELAIQSAEPQQ